MKNNNHILSQSIKDLPVYKPDASVLEKLETNLFQFPVDDMPSYYPSESLWDDIEVSVNNMDKGSILTRNSMLLVFILLLIFNPGHRVNDEVNITNSSENNSNSISLSTVDNVSNEADEVFQLNNVTNNIEKATLHNNNTWATPNQVNIVTDENIFQSKENSDNQILINKNTSVEEPHYNNQINPLTSIFTQTLINDNDYSHEIASSNLSPSKNEYDCSEFTGSTGYFAAGLSGTYNYFLIDLDTNFVKNPNWNSIDFNLSYHINKMYYNAGIGIVFSSDYSKLQYSYLQNELVNTYQNVDSMHYDPITGTTQFFFITVEVYDSIEYQKENNIKTKYNYVQFPFSIGYKFILQPNYSIGLRAGITYLYLYKETNNYPSSFQLDNSRLLELNYVTPKRRKNLLRFDIQLDMRYKVTRNLVAVFSPSINIYNSSIYGNINGSTLYSVGIKAGISYNF